MCAPCKRERSAQVTRRAPSKGHEVQYNKEVIRQELQICRRHGQALFNWEAPRKRFVCGRCRSEAVKRNRHKVKKILVDERGGQCERCGYSRCLRALHFHHVDAQLKSFSISRTAGIDRLRSEIRKCVLLCANCHAEAEDDIQVGRVNIHL